jgi:hypothetical protein
MSLSDTVKRQVETVLRAFCERRVPPQLRGEVRLTYGFRGNAVTLYEDRPFWKNPSQWSHMAIAQFRFDAADGRWTLFCADRSKTWHEYLEIDSSCRIESLLEEVDQDPTGIFFG